MFQLRKGSLFAIVQAGLVLAFAALLSACGEQPVPVDASSARAAVASTEHNESDIPVITVTASRTVPKNEG